MTGRNRAFATAGLWKLGDSLEAVLKLLPPERSGAIMASKLTRLRSGLMSSAVNSSNSFWL